jgi:hypothetical protein
MTNDKLQTTNDQRSVRSEFPLGFGHWDLVIHNKLLTADS